MFHLIEHPTEIDSLSEDGMKKVSVAVALRLRCGRVAVALRSRRGSLQIRHISGAQRRDLPAQSALHLPHEAEYESVKGTDAGCETR